MVYDPLPANEGRSWYPQDLLSGEQRVNTLGVNGFWQSIRQGRRGNESLKKQEGAKLLKQEREQGCETWAFQRLQEPVVLGTALGRVSTGQGPGYRGTQKTPGEIWFSQMRGFREF